MTQAGGATIGADARFDGRYKGGDLTVLGQVEGGLELSGHLRLGPGGRVKGTVQAKTAEIEGTFEGELRAETLAFGATARARGVFVAPRLSVRDGAQVDGAVNLDAQPGTTGTDPRGKGTKPRNGAPAGGPPQPTPGVSGKPAPTAGA